VCADIQLSGAPPTAQCLRYAISHEVLTVRNEEWWELDLEFLGREMDAVWINCLVRQDPEHASFYVGPDAARAARFLTGTLDNHRDLERTPNCPSGDGMGRTALIFSHWVGHDNSARWVGWDSIDERCQCS
jgi:hypothetical protein